MQSSKAILLNVLVWGFIIAAIGTGLVMRYTVLTQTVMVRPILADASEYFNYACNLRYHGVYSYKPCQINGADPHPPDAKRPPLFPCFASLFFGQSPAIAVRNTLLAQTLVQVLAMGFFTWVLIRRTGGFAPALPIALLWTFPHFININIYFLTESLFLSTLMTGLGVVLLVSERSGMHQRGRLTGFALGGLLIGLSCLIRPTLEFFPLFVIVIGLMFARKHINPILAFGLAALVPVVCWKIRNLLVLGVLSDPTLMVNALYHGSFPQFMYKMRPETYGFPYRFDPRVQETLQGVGATLSLISERFCEDPVRHLKWYLWGKHVYFWQWNILAGIGDIFIYYVNASPFLREGIALTMKMLHWLIHPAWIVAGLISYGLAAVYAVIRRRVSPDQLVLISMMAYITLLNVLIATFPRYGIPFKVLLITQLAFATRSAIRWFEKRSKGTC